jgi:hypothetical protein
MDELRRWLGVARSVAPQGAVAVAMVALAATTLAACASGHETGDVSDAGPLADVYIDGAGEPPPPPVSIETELPRDVIQAGQRVNARCILLDENGEQTAAPPGVQVEITYEPMSLFGQDGDGEVIGTTVGTATVRCAAPSIGLVDETPETLEIIAGAPHSVVTQLSSDTAIAGTSTDVTCLAFDVFGNEVTSFNHSVSLSPMGDGVQVDGTSVTVTRSGLYEVSCNVSGATELESAFLLVSPGLPASISVGLSPERDFYVIGDQVTLNTAVRDQFGNRVDDATLAYTHPDVTMLSPGRFQFGSDGTFTLTATVTSETLTEEPLFASVQVIVNTSGPDIECRRIDNQAVASDAYMIHRAPGSTVKVPVAVADDFEVAFVTINGTTATVNGSGNYDADVQVRFGMNFVDVVAVDTLGKENSRTCVFLASDRWVAENAFLDGALGLRLDQHAVDDGSAPPPLRSLNDVLQTVLNSDGLRNMLHQALLDANPLAERYFGFPAYCTARVFYRGNLQIGSATSSLQLLDNGLRARITLQNFSANVEIVGCCGTSGSMTISSLTAVVDLDLFLQGGLLRAAVRGEPTVSISGFNTNFGGFCGWVVDSMVSLFRGTVVGILEDELGGFVEGEFGPIIDDLLSNLDISTLGASFEVPRLDGSGVINLGFGVQLSSLAVHTNRLLLGIGTRFTPSQAAHERDTLGIALRQGSILLDPPGTNTSRPVGLSIHEGMLNQILHGLWRGGFFQGSLALGDGTATIDARLPAVAVVDGSQARLMLGGIRAEVTMPGLIDEPLGLTFGGEATASVSLEGDDLAFGDFTLDKLFVNFDTSISSEEREALEGFLTRVLQRVLADAINDGLPAIPIPTFELPDDLAEFGLPAGAELGITNPQLNPTGQHYVLTGGFGVR